MSLALTIIGWTVFGLLILMGLVLNLVGLFGNWLILAAVGGAAVLSGFEHFGGWTLPVLLVLAVLGEVFEMLAAGVGAAKFGGGKGAITAALVGCVLGAIAGSPLFPIIGTIIGACVGAFAAAALYEFLMREKRIHEAAWVGAGAAAGKIGGIVLKGAVGLLMLLIAALSF